MAEGASKYLFFSLLFVLTVCSSGNAVGFFYDARKHNASSSPIETISYVKLNNISPSQIRVFVADHRGALNSLSVYLYLNETVLENLRNYEPSTISRLKTLLTTFLPHANVKKTIIVSGSRDDLTGENGIPMLLSTLKSIHSVLGSFHLEHQVIKASVSISLSFLENLNRQQKTDLHRLLNFIKKIRSFVVIEATVDGDLSMGDQFFKSVIERATSVADTIPCSSVSVVLKIKSSVVPSAMEVSEFTNKILTLKNSAQATREITGFFLEVSPPEEFAQKELKREEEQIFHASNRELLDNFHHKTTQHDIIYPTTPVTASPNTNPTPTIVTFPSTNPVTVTPNPVAIPVTVPSTTPVPVPSPNPVNSPVPITNPVTTPGTVPGAQPITNPVTTYPAPTTGVPVTTPVTNPVAPPATTGSPAVPGQSWCVAKSGALETAIQAALDYACGIGGADCSTIQEGASCYNPDTLENHASYAFNSYYQKNPVQTSCDFGGTAMITNINPSTGTCIYPSSSSPTSSPLTATTPTPTTASPLTATTPTPTTTSSSGATVPGSGSPPAVLNMSNPASGSTTVFGESPPSFNSSTSMATGLQPFAGCIILVTSIVAGRFILDM